MSHYYTNDEIESRPTIIHFDYQGHSIEFHSDRGVFSKDSVDFGSRTLLDTVNLEGVKSVLDVGCGYGALSISLKMVYPDVTFDMVDVNRRAMDLAKHTIEDYHLEDMHVYESNAYDQVEKTFDMIISNPPIRAGPWSGSARPCGQAALRQYREGAKINVLCAHTEYIYFFSTLSVI